MVRELPTIAVLDWKEVPTYSEFILFQDYFASRGLSCVIADPREVEYGPQGLRAGDFQFNLIYKRVLIAELLDRDGGLQGKIVRAVHSQ